MLLEPPRNGCSAVAAPAPTGHWVLALSALTKWGFRRGEVKAVPKTEEMVAAALKCGDLLISRSNTRELVGLPGIFDEHRSDVSWPDTMMRLRPDSCQLRPAFLERVLRSPTGRKQIESFAAGTSASMKKINSGHVEKLLIPIPAVDIQDHINAQLDSFQALQQKARLRMANLADIKQNLLCGILNHPGSIVI
jgi:type I restriction enzyme S subunit